MLFTLPVSGMMIPLSNSYARCGRGRLPGMVWRRGDDLKHLGPYSHRMPHLGTQSQLYRTRCGLDRDAGPWLSTTDNDDVWCVNCIRQYGIPFEEIYD
jgi:hypothetical protein